MRFRLLALLAAGALLLLAVSIALAAKPKANYTYSTPTGSSPNVYFQAKNGKKLINFDAGMALKCTVKVCGGFGGIKSFTRASVKVSKKGTFKVSGKIVTEADKKLGTQTVTGRFVSPTEVKGKVATHLQLGQYKGVTEKFTATGTPSTT